MDSGARDGEHDLKGRFLRLVGGSAAEGGPVWWRVWRLFVEHAWYQQLLDQCVSMVMTRRSAPPGWLDDVKQDAILLLARDLRRTTDLNVDHDRVEAHFEPWMRTITMRHCQQALRGMRRKAEWTADEAAAGLFGGDDRRHQAARIDVQAALDRLRQPDRTVLSLLAEGWSGKEIAAELGITYPKMNYSLRRGIRRLRILLAAYQTTPAPAALPQRHGFAIACASSSSAIGL